MRLSDLDPTSVPISVVVFLLLAIGIALYLRRKRSKRYNPRSFSELLHRHKERIDKAYELVRADMPVDPILVACLRAILVADGLTNLAPFQREERFVWTRRVSLPAPYVDLSTEVDGRLNRRYDEMLVQRDVAREQQRRQGVEVRRLQLEREEQEQADYNRSLSERHKGSIEKFLEIAERKVCIIDDYGDEDWQALDREISKCLQKILKGEGKTDWGWGRDRDAYKWLQTELRARFVEYHKANRRMESQNEIALNRLSGAEFEAYVGRILERRGFQVQGTPTTGDQGADLIARKLGRKIVIQVKRSSRPVTNEAVQEVVAALQFYGANEGWVVTNATFTSSAKALAQANKIVLIDCLELRKLTREPQGGIE